MAINSDLARAKSWLRPVTAAIIAGAAGRRQGHAACLTAPALATASGDRAPAALAAPAVTLYAIAERRAGGKVERITPLGYRTAVRAGPRLLAGLDRGDPRARAAALLGDAVERIGSVGAGDLQGGDTKGGASDGGVTTRIKHAARLRLIEAAANGWPVDRRHGGVTRAAPRVLMAIRRQRGARREIRAFDALMALCVEGLDMADILAAHGWSVHSKHTAALGEALLSVLDDIADALAMRRPPAAHSA